MLAKFGTLVICLTAKSQIRQNFLLAQYTCMAVPYQTAMFKPTAMTILDPTDNLMFYTIHANPLVVVTFLALTMIICPANQSVSPGTAHAITRNCRI